MLNQPELTVIMPVYNMEKYLGRALDHLAQQTDSNFELLIVNDGSKDKTRKIAESYRDKFKHFRIINKENSGLSDTRNVGMANVQTPYFTFHDGDDWTDPGYTQFFVQAFHDHPEAAMVCCGFWIDYKNSQKSIRASKKSVNQMFSKLETYRSVINGLGSMCMNKAFVSPVKGYTWNKGYKTSVVRKYNLKFVEKLAFMEDQIFNIKYLSLTDGFYCDSTPLYHYWQRDDSMVHNFNLKMVPDNFKANYTILKMVIDSLLAERKQKKLQDTEKMIRIDERPSNDYKG